MRIEPAPIPKNKPGCLASLQDMLLLFTSDGELFDRATHTVKRAFDAPIMLMTPIDTWRQWLKPCIDLDVREIGRGISFCDHAVAEDQMLVIPNTQTDPHFSDSPLMIDAPHIRFYTGRSVRNLTDYLAGTLCVIDQKPRPFEQAERRLLDDLTGWIKSGFRERGPSKAWRFTLTKLQVVRHESLADPMLGIWNQHAATELLMREYGHAMYYRQPLSLLVVDADYFKRVSGTYGRFAGDAILVEIIRKLRMDTRPVDVVGRYGGEESLVLLPDTTTTQAIGIVERLRSVVESLEIATPKASIHCIISVGLVSCEQGQNPYTPADLIMRVDVALLVAKRLGCSRVISDGQPVQISLTQTPCRSG